MKKKTKIFFVRHGSAKLNEMGMMQGGLVNPELSLEGIKQAERLAQRLKSEKIDVIYCSDLERCKQTVNPLLKLKNIPIVYTKDLRERSFGIFDGRPINEWLEHLEKNNQRGKFDYRPENGESFFELQVRMRDTLNKILEKEKGKNILIVFHGSAKVSLLLSLFEKEVNLDLYDKYRPKNTALSIVEIDEEDNYSLKLLNCTKHLE